MTRSAPVVVPSWGMRAHELLRRRGWRRALLVGAPVAVVVLLLAAWELDVRGHDGRVARNVSLAGHGVGGDSRDELAAEVSRQADAARIAPVHIVTPHASYDTTADTVELSIDQPATMQKAMKVGHGDNVLIRPFKW